MSLLPQRPRLWSEAEVWQEVEFGSYALDLPLWQQLAQEARGLVAELGAGSGRVARALAREGHEVLALERDPELVAALAERAAELPLTVLEGDVVELATIEAFEDVALAIGPLQVVQLLDARERASMLEGLAARLASGGRAALALVDESTLAEQGSTTQLRPDMREVSGWVYSSQPLWVQVDDERLRMRRLRERVAPDGDLTRRVHDDVLRRLGPDRLEADAAAAGLRAAGRHSVEATPSEAGSIVVVLEAPEAR